MKLSESVGVAFIIEKMVENRFKWFEYVERKHVDYVVRRVDQRKDKHFKKEKDLERL